MFSNIDLSSRESKKKQFAMIDITKFICSILVVMIHTNPFSDVNAYLNFGVTNYLARLAVPFFFIGGVFLF